MPPHVTHFKMKAQPGERQRVIDLFERWFRDRRPRVVRRNARATEDGLASGGVASWRVVFSPS